jgi:threonine dehydratase
MDLSVERIKEAARVIDPVFLDSPQFVDEQLSASLGRRVLVKVETLNPLRSFKGRGALFLAHRPDAGLELACSSTGNFGQAIAYAARTRGMTAHVFVPEDVNPAKLDRLYALGAVVRVSGRDVQEAKLAARAYAGSRAACLFVEHGKDPEISEGAGTIGVELLRAEPVDTVVLPVGDGALITGVARWLKHQLPGCHIIGVCAAGAPAMAQSWRTGVPAVGAAVDTVADGIAVRAPIPESVQRLRQLVDDIVLVDDTALLDAMRLILATLGVLPEPAGAAGIAAIRQHDLPGDRLATVISGGTIRPDLLLSFVAHGRQPPRPPPHLSHSGSQHQCKEWSRQPGTAPLDAVRQAFTARRRRPQRRRSLPRNPSPFGEGQTFPEWSLLVVFRAGEHDPRSAELGGLRSCSWGMATMRTWPFPCRVWRCQGAPMTHASQDPTLPGRRAEGSRT